MLKSLEGHVMKQTCIYFNCAQKALNSVFACNDVEMESDCDEVEVEDSQNFASMHVEPPEPTHIFFSSSEESTKDV